MSKQELYKKNYQHLSPDEVRALYEKYRLLNRSVLEREIETPRPVTVGADHITFERLAVDDTSSLIAILNEEGEETLSHIFKRVGSCLAALHQVLKKKRMIHGDFWPGNIFLGNDRIVVIDFEPPRFGAKNSYPCGEESLEQDLAVYMVRSLLVYKKSRLYKVFQNHDHLLHQFMDGYCESGGRYDNDLLISLMQKERQRQIDFIMKSGLFPWYKKIAHRMLIWIVYYRNRVVRFGIPVCHQ